MTPSQRVRGLLDQAQELLPSQGPLTAFVHHNPLHALEDRPFHDAVRDAARRLGAEPYLEEDVYRRHLETGRILPVDLERVLRADLGPRGEEPIGPFGPRFDVRVAIARRGLRVARGRELVWLLAETGAVERLRDDLASARRARLLAWTRGAAPDLSIDELGAMVARALWSAARDAAARHCPPPAPPRSAARLRDVILAACGRDLDDLVNPVLTRWCAAFLDQGLAAWSFPERGQGFFRSVLALYGSGRAAPGRWAAGMSERLAAEAASGRDALESIAASLEASGETAATERTCVESTLLATRGFAGMMRQLELRPDRVPRPVSASLADFLAVRLLLDRQAATWLARRHLAHDGPLAALRARPESGARTAERDLRLERAFVLFQLAQLTGTDPDRVRGASAEDVHAAIDEVETFGGIELRRTLHEAFERRHEVDTLDSLTVHGAPACERDGAPSFQAVFCIDEREESIRRHLEEVEPTCETASAAGHFGVPMYYRGAGDARAVPLCPVVVRPEHEVVEVVDERLAEEAQRRARSRRTLGRLRRRLAAGSRTPLAGALVTSVLGAAAAIPAVFRVLLPRWTEDLRRRAAGFVEPPTATRLLVEHHDAPPSLGRDSGFTAEEMARIVRVLLEDAGLIRRLAPLVVVVGHGSSSLNNPHEAAYHCGACGGGRGGPNARAFALMANDPDVRSILAAAGYGVPPGTWFVGAMHDTCSDDFVLYDAERAPPSHDGALASVRRALDVARARNSHERCRRFASVPLTVAPAHALRRVAARAADLAQARPETGHATNAVCVVGRRTLTRGLFMDRRTFLVSYDPIEDDDVGTVLTRLLPTVLDVVAGINLEYWFSRVDPTVYGCGTKLPHNVTGLLGVMDGHQSDLRTGLPWQMVELHEPVRLVAVVDARPETLRIVLAACDGVRRLARHRWVRLVCRDPRTGELLIFQDDAFVPHVAERIALPRVARSADWYTGHRDHLGHAQVASAEPRT